MNFEISQHIFSTLQYNKNNNFYLPNMLLYDLYKFLPEINTVFDPGAEMVTSLRMKAISNDV